MGDAQAGATAGGVNLRLGCIDRLRISVVRVEYVSMMMMLADAFGGINRGLPQEWGQQVKQAVSAAAGKAAQSLGTSGGSVLPSFLVPFVPNRDFAPEEIMAGVRDADPADLVSDLFTEFGEELPPAWRRPADRPKDWIGAYCEAAAAAQSVTSVLWKAAEPLLDREIERAGVAVVRGGNAGLLSTLNSRIRLAGDSLQFVHSSSGNYEIGNRSLVLVPMVSGDRMLCTNFDHPDHVWIGYPVPGAGDLHGKGPAPAATDPLACLIGPVRAAILRQLEKPAFMGELATALQVAPGAITFHCDRLEGSRLVVRARRGRSVRVTRSELGDKLLELYRL